MRKDRRKRLLDMVDKDLDVRDRWMGISYLKKGYQPIPYTIKDDKGKRVAVGNKAHEAANFLATANCGPFPGAFSSVSLKLMGSRCFDR